MTSASTVISRGIGSGTATNARETCRGVEVEPSRGANLGTSRSLRGATDQRTRHCKEVASAAREDVKMRTREKFGDVFQVKSECTGLKVHDIENMSNDVSVVGRLSKPEHM